MDGTKKNILTMPVERIHPLERLATTLAFVGPVVEMKLLMALAIVSSCKAFPAPGPLALEWLLFVVRTHMAYEGG